MKINKNKGFITLPVILAVLLTSITGYLVADKTGLLGSGGEETFTTQTVTVATDLPSGAIAFSDGVNLIGDSANLFFGDSGNIVGIASTVPSAQFAIEASTAANTLDYVFAIGSTGTDTPSILVQNSTGKVAMGTKKFSGNAVLQLGLTDAGTTFTSATSLLTLHNESSTNNTSAVLAARTTDGTGALAAAGRLGWQIEDHTSLSVDTDFAVSTILNGTEGEAFRVENDGDFGIATNTIGAGQQFAVKGAGLFKGGLYAQATTTTSSLIATSTLSVGTSTPAGGNSNNNERFVVDGVALFAGHIESQAQIGVSSKPLLSSCGTAPVISGSDTAGLITIGTGVTTACTLTFSNAFPNTPACVISGDNTAVTYAVTARSTTAFTFSSSADMASDVVGYMCIGIK